MTPRWTVSQRFHHIRDDEKWPILRINRPDLSTGRFAEEIKTFDVTRLPWSLHQLIVPDPFVPTHVCYLPLKLFLIVDWFLRITPSMYIEAHCTTSPC